jgi:putative SOS response-associated peptidase YedK
MCGRVDIHTPPSELARLLDAAMTLGVDPDGRPSWNVPPSRGVPVIVEDGEIEPGGRARTQDEPPESSSDQSAKQRFEVASAELKRRLDIYRWGLLPHWAKDTRVGYKMINAKAETLTKSPAYRVPFRQQRCLVVVDGFFEWQTSEGEESDRSEGPKKNDKSKKKLPFYFRRADGKPITFAGLYETWWDKSRSKEPDPETLLKTCTIITTEAGPDMVEVHNRMPVIIEHDDMDAWLDPQQHDTESLSTFLHPAPKGTLVKHPVSRTVNSPRNDGPDMIVRLESPED